MEGSGDIRITIKSSNDQNIKITTNPTSTIRSLKAELASLNKVPAANQRLIYSGRVLKDDDTIGSYKIADGHTYVCISNPLYFFSLHLVKSGVKPSTPAVSSSPATSTPAARTAPAPAADPFASNPMLAGLDPAMLSQLGGNMPDAASLREMMSNPAIQRYS